MLYDRPLPSRRKKEPLLCKHFWVTKRIKDPKIVKQVIEANGLVYQGHRWVDVKRCKNCKVYFQAEHRQ